MTWIDAYPTVHVPFASDRSANGTAAPSAPATERDASQDRECWQRLIDGQLLEWGRDPEQLADDGIAAPTREIIVLACTVAARCRDAGLSPPLRVVPNGSAGLVFERLAGSVFETIEIRADGSVELASFQNSQLRHRQRIS